MSVLRPVGATPCHRANPSVHVSRNQRSSGVTSRSTPRNASWARSRTLSRRAAVKSTKGCAARNAFEVAGSFDRLVPGRNATTLSARSFCLHSETSGGRYGTRARFGAGAAAGSVDILLQQSAAFELVSDDPQCGEGCGSRPRRRGFFRLLRNQFVRTAATGCWPPVRQMRVVWAD